MSKIQNLAELLSTQFGQHLTSVVVSHQEVTAQCDVAQIKPVLLQLRDQEQFAFDQLIDICAVDYLYFGQSDWQTESATETGFSRGVEPRKPENYALENSRFAVVYHLLSLKHNHRLRVKVFLNEQNLIIPSAHAIWKGANWFEREAYDLYGVLFEGHPDLRRILTDYGFIGHPFRKDFPISGHVEMRYDAHSQQVIYGPVEIVPRVLVPKVIRHDNRYLMNTHEGQE
jgi:NADH-quinone oxidoreductase subunit C